MRTPQILLLPDPLTLPEIKNRLHSYLRISGQYVLRTAAGVLAIGAMSYLFDIKEFGTAAALVLWLFFFLQAQASVGKVLFGGTNRIARFVYSAAVTFFLLSLIYLEISYHQDTDSLMCIDKPVSMVHYVWSAWSSMIVVWELGYIIILRVSRLARFSA